jgi:hypothetical protein
MPNRVLDQSDCPRHKVRRSQTLGILLVGPDSAGIIYAKPVLHCTSPCAGSKDRKKGICDHSFAADTQLVGVLHWRVANSRQRWHPMVLSNLSRNEGTTFRTLSCASAVFKALLADASGPISLQRHSPRSISACLEDDSHLHGCHVCQTIQSCA